MSYLGNPISRPKKLAFVALAAVLVIAVIEGGAALLLGLSQGQWPSLAEVATQRGAVMEAEDPTGPAMPAADRLGVAETLHPYLGFTRDPEPGDGTEARAEAPASESATPFEERLFFEPSTERVVIGVLGGSVADIVAAGGAGLAVELRKVDRFAGREIEVVSLAQGGFKQPQQLTLLAYLLALGAHFDLVLNIDGFNEVALPATELVPRGVFPFFPRGWDQRVGPLDSKARRVAAEARRGRGRRRILARRFSAWPWRASHAAALAWQALDARAAQDIASAELSLLEARSDDVTYGSHGPRRGYGSPAEMYEDLARFWYRSSLQLYYLCRSQGIEYRHFLQPNQYPEGAKPITAEQAAGTWLPDHPYRQAAEQGYPWLIRFGHQLADQGVAFEDLIGIFADREELLYVDSCCHLNFLGNTLLQRTIARRLAGGQFDRPENLSDGGLALEGYDPVSYFDQGPLRGRAEIAATHEGVRYRFASPENRGRFLADPERYLPRYGGWCAFGLGVDEAEIGVSPERYPVDPESYEISGGELYLFHRSRFIDARELWRRDRDRIRQRAAETWRRLRGGQGRLRRLR